MDKTSFEDRYFAGKRDPATTVTSLFVLIFIALALIIWAILAFFTPTWCQTGKNNLNSNKAFGAALLISFFFLIILALIWHLTGGYYNNTRGLSIGLLIIVTLIIIVAIICYCLSYL